MDNSLSWGTWSLTVDGAFLSGSVVTIDYTQEKNVITPAAGGVFRGLLFSEVSQDVDDTLASSPPVVITSMGNGLVLVRNTVLDRTLDYTSYHGLVTSGTSTNLGKIVPVAGTGGTTVTTDPTAIVGRVQEIYADSVLLHLNTPTDGLAMA